MKDLIEKVAQAIALTDNVNFDEVCGYDTDAEECDSGTCVAALWEEHDAHDAREYYRSHAKAVIPLVIEECAKVADGYRAFDNDGEFESGQICARDDIAAAIRALGGNDD